MAVAKTKEPPEAVETEKESTETEATVKKSELVETVREILIDLLPGKGEGDETEGETKAKPEKRQSLRDEEESTRSMVADAVKDFLAKAPAEDDKGEKKVATETVPATSTVRKIEKWLWGKE